MSECGRAGLKHLVEGRVVFLDLVPQGLEISSLHCPKRPSFAAGKNVDAQRIRFLYLAEMVTEAPFRK